MSLTFNGSASFTLGANGSQARSSAMLFQNAALSAGDGAYFQSGQDMRFAGANVKARRLTIDAGRDLLMTVFFRKATVAA